MITWLRHNGLALVVVSIIGYVCVVQTAVEIGKSIDSAMDSHHARLEQVEAIYVSN